MTQRHADTRPVPLETLSGANKQDAHPWTPVVDWSPAAHLISSSVQGAAPLPLDERAGVDRGGAVNLARNMLDRYDCKGITEKGVRTLCEAIMRMDAALSAASPAAAVPSDAERDAARELLIECSEALGHARRYGAGDWSGLEARLLAAIAAMGTAGKEQP